MPTYAYKGRNRLNETVAGEKAAANQDELRALLRREQIVMTQASEKGREISIPKRSRRPTPNLRRSRRVYRAIRRARATKSQRRSQTRVRD